MAWSLSGRRFAPRLGWTLLALAGAALFVSLGRWQLDRAEQKRVLFEGFSAGDALALRLPASFEPVERYRRVRTRGRYDSVHQFLLENMTYEGVAGFHVLTPLVLADGRTVLVNRGFLPSSGRRDELPALPVGDDAREVTGRADFLPRAAVELAAPSTSGWPRLVSFPHIEDIRHALGTDVFPQVLLLDPDQPDGFLRDWRPPGLRPDQHLGYAVQWFGLAATVLATWTLLSFRRKEDLR